jgi:hypothetical protein
MLPQITDTLGVRHIMVDPRRARRRALPASVHLSYHPPT